jgi:hypothetical protein
LCSALLFFTAPLVLFAQEIPAEAAIKALEQKERKATLEKDAATLRNVWNFNSPFNRVVKGGNNSFDRPVITQLHYASFERNAEEVLVNGSIAMGNEIVVEKVTIRLPGRTLKRRYTNTWQKHNTTALLIGRHANLLCAAQ